MQTQPAKIVSTPVRSDDDVTRTAVHAAVRLASYRLIKTARRLRRWLEMAERDELYRSEIEQMQCEIRTAAELARVACEEIGRHHVKSADICEGRR